MTSNGTSITIALPAAAGPGDVLVRKNGSSHSNLSNPRPFDPRGAGACHVVTYCTAKISSSGCLPSLSANSGVASLSFPAGFLVTCSSMGAGMNGLLYFGLSGQAALPFQGGILCVAAPVTRTGVESSGGAAACSGTISTSLGEMLAVGQGSSIVAGSVVDAQVWSRDVLDPFGSSLSDGIEFAVCP